MQAFLAKLIATQFGPVIARVLGSSWQLMLITILVFIIIYQNVSDRRWLLVNTIPSLKAELLNSKSDLNIIEQSNERLTESLDSLNAEARKWELMSRELKAENIHLQNDLIVIRHNTNSKVRTIVKEVAPRSCTEAFEYLRDNIPYLQYNGIFGEGDYGD